MIRPVFACLLIALMGLCLAPARLQAANIDAAGTAATAKSVVADTAASAKTAVADTATATGEGVKTLRKTFEAQGDISPQTAHAIDAMSKPPGAQFNKDAGKGKGANAQRNSGKAIYGDIIIHR